MPHCYGSTRARVLHILNAAPKSQLPSVTLRGKSEDVHGLSLLVIGAIIGIVATAAVIYLSQPRQKDTFD
jgi:hypothetical protein